MADFLSHRFEMLDSGTTVGTLTRLGSTVPEIAIFVSVPELKDLGDNFRELAKLLHEGAIYGSRCRSNGAHKKAGSREFSCLYHVFVFLFYQ